MSPSSSSSADAAAGPTFTVATRELSAALDRAGPDESSRDLGALNREALADLLRRLIALDTAQIGDADPHLVVTGPRGRFAIKPNRGKLLLRDAADIQQGYFELTAEQAPEYLEGRDPVAAPAETLDSLADAKIEKPQRTGLAAALFALTFIFVAASAWFTFRPDDYDPGSDYDTLTAPAEVATLRQQAIGTYATADEEERRIEIRADGTVIYKETGSGAAETERREGPFTIARRRVDNASVLRVEGLGTIELRDAQTILFAREPYKRTGSTNVISPAR